MGNKKKQRQKSASTPPQFALGTLVRVKPGTTNPDFPDIPLGGWAGIIKEVNSKAIPPIYLIEWNQHTLDHHHPVYRKRCQRDEREITSMWLDENDLELDTGEPLTMEQPTNLTTHPLSRDDQEDRIRMVLGLTSDDPLPNVDRENLGLYRRYLATHLSIPFQACYSEETGPFRTKEHQVTVLGILEAAEGNEEEGVWVEAAQQGQTVELPLADLEVTVNLHNRTLIEDYSYWFENHQGNAAPFPPSSPADAPAPPSGWRVFSRMLCRCGIYGAVYGTILGAMLGVSEEAQVGAGLGAVLLGVVGCLAGGRYGFFFGAVHRYRFGPVVGAALGTVCGALPGALAGVAMVIMFQAWIGTLMGGGLGLVWGWGMPQRGWARTVGRIFGAGFLGALFLLLYQDTGKALGGAAWGGLAGGGAGAVLYLAVVGAMIGAAKSRESSS